MPHDLSSGFFNLTIVTGYCLAIKIVESVDALSAMIISTLMDDAAPIAALIVFSIFFSSLSVLMMIDKSICTLSTDKSLRIQKQV
jgi:hypothetical protein